MKRLILLFAFFYLLTFSASAQQYYYWYQDRKVPLTADSSVIYAEFKNANSVNVFLKSNASIASLKGDIQRKNDSSVIFMFKSANQIALLSQLSSAFTFSSPLLKFKSSKIMLVPQIILELKDNYTLGKFLSQYKGQLSLKDTIGPHEYLLNVKTKSFEKVLSIANEIYGKKMVDWCEPNFYNSFRVTDDPLYNQQYYFNNTGQNGGTPGIDINAPEAWDITKGSSTLRVAVIDEGVEDHEEFSGRLLPGYTAGNPNGYGAPQNGNDKAHGEACAGIIAGTQDNNIGIKGMDPNVQIVPVNIFPNIENPPYNPDGVATTAQIAQAINWAYDSNGGDADVLSCSWGGGSPSSAITAAIANARTQGREGKGCPVVFASGNTIPYTNVEYPGNLDGVITVGAINNTGGIWNYSDRGASMDLVAPSGNVNQMGDVVTTDRMGNLGVETGNYTTHFGGTSAACPQVSGTVCLMLSINPDLSESEVRSILQVNATDMGSSGFDNTYGYGRLDACRAVAITFQSTDITGAATFCSGSETYSISNAINGNIVTWSASPSGIVSLAANGDQVTATKIGNGNVTLKAAIATDCGNNYYISRYNISVGAPPAEADLVVGSDRQTLAANNSVCITDEHDHVTINFNYSPISNLQAWSYDGHVSQPIITGSYMNFDWLKDGNQYYDYATIRIEYDEACGHVVQFANLENTCHYYSLYTISPNPATYTVTITGKQPEHEYVKIRKSPNSASENNGYIQQVKIYDPSGKLRMQKTFSGNKSQVQMNVSKLSAGIYFVKINGGKFMAQQKLVIK